ncbi:hypothetical protein ACH492_00290 [Streptomyces sp. NPDC019443]
MPDHYSPRLVAALTGLFEGADTEEANKGDTDFEQYMTELITLKAQ